MSGAAPADPVRILLVDDQPENLTAMEAILMDLGQVLVRAGSGREALRALLQHEFALILMDVMMPDLDGFATATLIRQREADRTTPIIFVTAAHRTEDLLFQGYSVGAVDCVFKPIVPEILRSKVKVFVELAHNHALVRRQVEQLRRQTEDLAAARATAQSESEFKSQFVARMSHEMRTPLNAILGFAELMADGKLGSVSVRHREVLGDILKSGRHLLAIVNDVLDLAKVASGRLVFQPEIVDAAALAYEVRDGLGALSLERQVRVEVEAQDDIGPAWLDPGRLKQVLYNYLSNAIKFSPAGAAVEVRLRRVGSQLSIEVADQGPGVSPEEQPELFREFQQGFAGRSHGRGGTGLGLALTRLLVEAQGGSVGVRSSLGRGSVFFATLPLGGSEARAVQPAPPETLVAPEPEGGTHAG